MSKTDHQQRVEEFMRLAGQEVPDRPTIPSEDVRILRAKLILEEAFETIEKGLGIQIRHSIGTIHNTEPLDFSELSFKVFGEPNIEEIADGCTDLRVVTTGCLSACGIHDKKLTEEVDAANLRKFGPGGYRREDGKWLKPADWQPPDIKKVLEQQGSEDHP